MNARPGRDPGRLYTEEVDFSPPRYIAGAPLLCMENAQLLRAAHVRANVPTVPFRNSRGHNQVRNGGKEKKKDRRFSGAVYKSHESFIIWILIVMSIKRWGLNSCAAASGLARQRATLSFLLRAYRRPIIQPVALL